MDRCDVAAGVVAELRAGGAAELRSPFMFPVMGEGRRQWCHYARIEQVRWRDSAGPFYVRCAAVPFDTVPLRRTDPARIGVWFSVGPGRADETSDDLVEVVLLQLEGPPAADPAMCARWRETVASTGAVVVAEQGADTTGRELSSYRLAASLGNAS